MDRDADPGWDRIRWRRRPGMRAGTWTGAPGWATAAGCPAAARGGSLLPHALLPAAGGRAGDGEGERRARGFLGDRAWQERLPWQPGRTREFGK